MLTVCENAEAMSYSDNVGEEIKMKGRILQDIFSTLVQCFLEYKEEVEMFRV